MKFSKLFSFSLVLVFLLSFSSELDAQKRGSKKRESKETTEESSSTSKSSQSRSSRDKDSNTESIPIKDRIIYDIHIGQLGFNRGFTISAKGGAAYKFSDRFSVGIGLKNYYYLQNNQGSANDISVLNWGPYIYPRFKISEQIYLKAEYYYISFDNDPFNTGNSDRINEGIPMFGAGYVSGFGPWKFGLELLFIPSDSDRDLYYGDVFEYMFSFIYNF